MVIRQMEADNKMWGPVDKDEAKHLQREAKKRQKEAEKEAKVKEKR